MILPNPNPIIAAEDVESPRSSVMAVNVVSAVIGLILTLCSFLCYLLVG